MTNQEKRRGWLKYVVFAVLVYVAVTSAIYRFRHPEMTETELFLNLPNAVAFQE